MAMAGMAGAGPLASVRVLEVALASRLADDASLAGRLWDQSALLCGV